MPALNFKERPILFSGAMVRAILEGSKTQSRRVMKSVTSDAQGPFEAAMAPGSGAQMNQWAMKSDGKYVRQRCPYGNPGDRIWVRETFAMQCNVEDDEPPFSDGRPVKRFDNEDESGWLQAHYKATDPQPELACPESPRHNCGSDDICASPWQPSIHMPRWASRLTLEITKVRVERVQEISEEDAIAEGVERNCLNWNDSEKIKGCPACEPSGICQAKDEFIHDGLGECDFPVTAKEAYRYLWDSINSKRGYAWDKNPWVWVIEFKRIKAAQ